MLNIDTFNNLGVKEDVLYWEQFEGKDGKIKEVSLSFCYELIKDNAWYQTNVGNCLITGYESIEEHRFNSLKKAIKWWNNYFEKNI